MNDKPYYHLAQRVSDKTGLPTNWIYAQWAHETDDFTSTLTLENNNFGGVCQVEPNGEENKQPDGDLYYMHFNTPDEYADYFANYIKKFKEDGVMDAKTLEEYAYALKKGGYYGDSYENYSEGMRNKLANIEPINNNFGTKTAEPTIQQPLDLNELITQLKTYQQTILT